MLPPTTRPLPPSPPDFEFRSHDRRPSDVSLAFADPSLWSSIGRDFPPLPAKDLAPPLAVRDLAWPPVDLPLLLPPVCVLLLLADCCE